MKIICLLGCCFTLLAVINTFTDHEQWFEYLLSGTECTVNDRLTHFALFHSDVTVKEFYFCFFQAVSRVRALSSLLCAF